MRDAKISYQTSYPIRYNRNTVNFAPIDVTLPHSLKKNIQCCLSTILINISLHFQFSMTIESSFYVMLFVLLILVPILMPIALSMYGDFF